VASLADGLSYAVSYLFIAIIWINHHHLMPFVGPPTLGLIWTNFVHLFMVSLLPFVTAWVAHTRLPSAPVVFNAGLFVWIDVAYNVFEYHVLARAGATRVSAGMRRMEMRRSLLVLVGFTTVTLVALVAPRPGFGLICAALVLHLRSEVRGFKNGLSRETNGKLIEVVQEADRNGLAIGHFNIADLVLLKGVFEAARELKMPVIVGASEGEREFAGTRQLAAAVRSLREEFNFPIFLNADHTHSLAKAMEAVKGRLRFGCVRFVRTATGRKYRFDQEGCRGA
jgi:uncharacterized membrane protein